MGEKSQTDKEDDLLTQLLDERYGCSKARAQKMIAARGQVQGPRLRAAKDRLASPTRASRLSIHLTHKRDHERKPTRRRK